MEQVREPAQATLDALNEELSGQTPQGIIEWAIREHGEGLVLACSFGGISGMALLDMATKLKPDIDIFYLDTDFLFPQTHALREEAIKRYNIRPVGYRSMLTPEQQAEKFGGELWKTNPELCCGLRKVEPSKRALEGRTAWITGLRRDQASTRRAVQPVMWDEKHGLYKVNPLAFWDEKQVWRYIFEHDVPYNELHDQGFPSLGCTHCTRAVGQGEDMRAGRWSGTAKVECGLHK